MQEAGLDFGLRCLLMGHKTNRPAYGDGGSLNYRRDELLKIVHPFSMAIFDESGAIAEQSHTYQSASAVTAAP
jgi:hypothetical protein